MTTKKAPDTEPQVADNAPTGLQLSASEQAEARKEGAKDDVKEAAKEAHRFLTDGQLPGEPLQRRWFGSDEIAQYEPLLALGLDEFTDLVNEKGDDAIPEEKVAGLLKLERAGQNRTPYVKLLCRRLKVKSPYEVTDAGPPYTNDISNITSL